MGTMHLCLDESGHLHKNSAGRYFVIAGYITEELNNLKRAFKKEMGFYKKKKGIPLDCEVKGSAINNQCKKIIIKSIGERTKAQQVAIIVDKEQMYTKIVDVNEFYNYFVQHLLHYLMSVKKVIELNAFNKIIVHIDARGIRVKSLNTLEAYLNTHFRDAEGLDIEIEVIYKDSQSNLEIQAADILSNYLWRKSNYHGIEKINYTDKHYTYFPYRTFGKILKKIVKVS